MHSLLLHCYLCVLLCKINSVQNSDKIGGRSIRSEPQALAVFDTAREILIRAGWITYFTQLQQPHETVAIELL